MIGNHLGNHLIILRVNVRWEWQRLVLRKNGTSCHFLPRPGTLHTKHGQKTAWTKTQRGHIRRYAMRAELREFAVIHAIVVVFVCVALPIGALCA